ncbi:dynamin family protein [Streptomyces sp. S.PB5]|uniref:dynamin family protein n=1 Tax=Streptomyces sp. S.PB5 TaxID=3020844 RepID=UPI0025B18E10|nr:dynamin family protein [Streptomyces sp. S.PB5]MDN3025888.1 dynamin family protein [Streptomyces sp. S.PB5]
MPDNAFSRLRSDILGVFPKLTEQLGAELGPRQQEVLDQSKARLEQGTCHVVVVGEFKRGKSTLLNALVERPGLFPVDVDVATCVVSTLGWGPRERAVVHFEPLPGESAANPVEVGTDRLPEFVTEQGNPRNHKRVRLLELQAPAPQLESGLVLADTPGVGSSNPAHTTATNAFLQRADGLIFVCDAIEPLATYELDFLSQALTMCEVVITVVTKTDKVRDPAPVIAGAREKIAARTGRPVDDLVVVPVSAFRKLKWLRGRDDDQLLADSGFPELDQALWEGLATTCGGVQLRRALDALADAVTTAGSPVVNELAALESDESLRRIRQEVSETAERMKRLSAGSAEWRTDLRQRFDRDTRPARTALQNAFSATLRGYQEKVTAGADPGGDELVGQVASEMLQALNTANDQLAASAASLMEEFARRTSLTLTSPDVPKPPFTPAISVPTVPLNVRPARFWDMFRASWATGMAGAGAGGTVALVEPFSGLALAMGMGTMGFVHGVRNHRKDLHERAEKERNARMLQLVTQEIAESRRLATESFNQAHMDVAQALIGELNTQLAAQQESLAESSRRLQEATGKTKADLATRRGELLARQQTYRATQGELDRLRARVERLTEAPSRRPVRPRAGAGVPAATTPTRAASATATATAKNAAADIALGVAAEAAMGTAFAHAGQDPTVKDVTAGDGAEGTPDPMAAGFEGSAEAVALSADPEGLEAASGTASAQDLGTAFDPDQFDAP